MSDYDDLDGDSCQCNACRQERADAPLEFKAGPFNPDAYNDELASDDADVPMSEHELDLILNDIFGTDATIAVSAPEDIDTLFDQLFGPSQDPKDYPFGPASFNEDEVRTISESLKFRGKSIADSALQLIAPDMDLFWNSIPDDVSEDLEELLEVAFVESKKCRELYDWFADQFGIRA